MTYQNSTFLETNPARVAGFMFVFVIAIYMCGFIITGSFSVAGNIAETARNIMEAEPLYRMAMFFELIAVVGALVLAWALYVLLEPVNRNLALLALFFRMGECAVGGFNMSMDFFTLTFFSGSEYLTAFAPDQLEALMKIFSRASSPGFFVAVFFFSPGSIIFWYLLFKSKFIPRALAGFGIFASVMSMLVAVGVLHFPTHMGTIQIGFLPIFIAELSGGLWLLIKGVNVAPWGNNKAKTA